MKKEGSQVSSRVPTKGQAYVLQWFSTKSGYARIPASDVLPREHRNKFNLRTLHICVEEGWLTQGGAGYYRLNRFGKRALRNFLMETERKQEPSETVRE